MYICIYIYISENNLVATTNSRIPTRMYPASRDRPFVRRRGGKIRTRTQRHARTALKGASGARQRLRELRGRDSVAIAIGDRHWRSALEIAFRPGINACRSISSERDAHFRDRPPAPHCRPAISISLTSRSGY
jgi:hypothetical protein